jgi:hypothetical protein
MSNLGRIVGLAAIGFAIAAYSNGRALGSDGMLVLAQAGALYAAIFFSAMCIVRWLGGSERDSLTSPNHSHPGQQARQTLAFRFGESLNRVLNGRLG